MSESKITVPDLTQRPPRSPRCRLGGYAGLPRMLDKGRAAIAGKNGEYHYDCPLDQRILSFLGIEAEALKKELAAGKEDFALSIDPDLPLVRADSAQLERAHDGVERQAAG